MRLLSYADDAEAAAEDMLRATQASSGAMLRGFIMYVTTVAKDVIGRSMAKPPAFAPSAVRRARDLSVAPIPAGFWDSASMGNVVLLAGEAAAVPGGDVVGVRCVRVVLFMIGVLSTSANSWRGDFTVWWFWAVQSVFSLISIMSEGTG